MKIQEILRKIERVSSELARAWKFKMPAEQTPAMTTREHWRDLKRIVQQEGILEAVKYDLNLSFRSRQKERYLEINHYFIPSHPVNVKWKFNAWSDSGYVTPEELYNDLLNIIQNGSLQYEDAARGVASWYGYPTERINDALLEGKLKGKNMETTKCA